MRNVYMSSAVALRATNDPAYMRAVEKAYAYFNQPDRARDIISRQTRDSNWMYDDWRVVIDGNKFIPHYDRMTGIIQIWLM